jgi:hypothetical protein
MAFTNDGWLLTALQFRGHCLIDTVTGQTVRCLPTDAACVAFSPDGRVLATGHIPGREKRGPALLRLWDVATGTQLRSIDTDVWVLALAFTPDGKRLASALRNSTVLIWDVPALLKGAKTPKASPLKKEDLTSAWRDLGEVGGARAYDTILRLAAGPDVTLPFLKTRLRPAAEPDSKHLERLVAELDSDHLGVRTRARQELIAVSAVWEPLLRSARTKARSERVRRSLDRILAEPWFKRDAEVLRRVRAVQVLEYIGTREARAVLAQMAKGWALARETRFARVALDRLERRGTR